MLDRLILLDSCTRPGLSKAEFNRLFAKCRCGLVTTRRVFRMHICTTGATMAQNPPVVIDLTADDSNESESVSSGSSNHIIIDLTADSEDEQQ